MKTSYRIQYIWWIIRGILCSRPHLQKLTTRSRHIRQDARWEVLHECCFSARRSSPIFFGCFMTADHANFVLLTFREILVLNQKIPHRTTSNFVPPPALIICQRAHAPVECTASTTLPATVSQHTVTSSPSLVLHGPW